MITYPKVKDGRRNYFITFVFLILNELELISDGVFRLDLVGSLIVVYIATDLFKGVRGTITRQC